MQASTKSLRAALVLLALGTGTGAEAAQDAGETRTGSEGGSFLATPVAELDEPWAMTFLPDGRLLVTEMTGALLLVTQSGEQIEVQGTPEVDYGDQGGMGDVILHPDHEQNGLVYLSFAEAGDGNTRGAAVARARLVLDGTPRVEDLQVIWRQTPKVSGRGHYGHRLAFAPDGQLFITSGERQKFTPAQDLSQNLGKIIRIEDDGEVPDDNPFAEEGDVAAQVWSLGHRNPLGIAFDAEERLWIHEMGPGGGDEVNLVQRGANYGYPLVSDGDHYNGQSIPDHDTRPDLAPPKLTWTPVISPAGLVIYSGGVFPDWQGDMLIGGLTARALVRVALEGETAREAERYDMGRRIREVEQGPEGAVWVLEDGSGGRLLKLTPK